ncbi:hypothetical protein ACRAWF_37395 [Streptomyces sp. L7]
MAAGQQLLAYQEPISHYAKFTMTISRAMPVGRDGTTTGASGARPWTRASLVAPRPSRSRSTTSARPSTGS